MNWRGTKNLALQGVLIYYSIEITSYQIIFFPLKMIKTEIGPRPPNQNLHAVIFAKETISKFSAVFSQTNNL